MIEAKEDITWILAPMDGITDRCYRNAWMEVFGNYSTMKQAVSPFVTLVRGNTVRKSHLADLFPRYNRMEVEPQILGNEAEYFAPMARALSDMGYTSVNWNLGCPMRQVAGKRRGSGMLPYPEMIESFLNRVLPGSPLALSVKIRLGYFAKEEVFPVIEVLNRFPLKYVAIHPRIGKQLYTGEVDWDTLEEALGLLKHECVYSGDINSEERAQAFYRRFPAVSRIMLGRGVIADPFLPCRLSGTIFSAEEEKRIFARFTAVLFRNYREAGLPERTVLQRQKMFWSRFSGNFVPPNGFGQVKTVVDTAAYQRICLGLFGEDWHL